ncbi:MAG: lysophospholipid acyltransferase family protein [Treponemataceae bacterium]|nr:MAG: lysophospholipid acyltransferase family protein [Treponemataceae bacterium]
MSTFLLIASLALVFGGPSLAAVFLYPMSKKASKVLFDFVVSTTSPHIFAVMKASKNFKVKAENPLKHKMPERFVLISNHQSLLDIPLFFTLFKGKNIRFVAKEELGHRVPLISAILKGHGHCLVPRDGDVMKAMHVLAAFGRRCAENNINPAIFPEGTRSRNGELGAFYGAGFRSLSMNAKLPVVVCALDGAFKISGILGILRNVKNGKYNIKVLKIYASPKDKHECARILEESHSLIQAQLNEWRKK